MKITPLQRRGNMRSFIKTKLSIAILIFLCFQLPFTVFAQTQDVQKKLKGFDQYMEKVLKDWNVPGIGVGVVVKDQLVFARGYGYRDYEKTADYT